MDRYVKIKERLIECAKADSDIRAIIAIGSSTRSTIKADEYSDLDLFIVTKEVESWYSGEYPKRLGKVSISFVEPTLGGGRERRCIFDEDKDVDMIVLTPEQFKEALQEGICNWVMNRGYNFLYDADSYAKEMERYVTLQVTRPELSEEEFVNIVNDFFFHNIWAAKKLRRGERWSAKMCVDAYLKSHLLKMMECYCHELDGRDVWHDGRFLDRWAEPFITDALKRCFAHYEDADLAAALWETHNLFERITKELAEKKGYAYPSEAAACAKNYLLLPPGQTQPSTT